MTALTTTPMTRGSAKSKNAPEEHARLPNRRLAHFTSLLVKQLPGRPAADIDFGHVAPSRFWDAKQGRAGSPAACRAIALERPLLGACVVQKTL